MSGLGRTFAGTNRVPEALYPAEAGIDSAFGLTERIGKFGFIDGLGHRRGARRWRRIPLGISALLWRAARTPQ